MAGRAALHMHSKDSRHQVATALISASGSFMQSIAPRKMSSKSGAGFSNDRMKSGMHYWMGWRGFAKSREFGICKTQSEFSRCWACTRSRGVLPSGMHSWMGWWGRMVNAIFLDTHCNEPRRKQKYPHSQNTLLLQAGRSGLQRHLQRHWCWLGIIRLQRDLQYTSILPPENTGNIRIESGTGDPVLEELEPEQPITRTKLVEPQKKT